jgi:peptidoglycan/LPS O-acetylase OafA/YrhL
METSNPVRNIPLGYLRAFLVLLVVAHHAVIAYCSYAPPPGKSLDDGLMLWTAFPVVDAHRWSLADLWVGFDDTFFMSLFFLISGLFLWPSLARRGAGGFLRERVLRLGLPFLVTAGVLAPLAYYPAYLGTGAHTPFWTQWFALGAWPAGPAWFLWVLLAFTALATLFTKLVPGWGVAVGRAELPSMDRPVACFASLLVVSALTYMPLAAIIDPSRWLHAGPFFVQGSRLLHYAVYFCVGAVLGAYGLERGLLAPAGKLARRWPLWVIAAVLAFLGALVLFFAILASLAQGGPGALLGGFGNFAFVLSCAASCFACLALALRFARHPAPVLDSLGANAYGIYLGHYCCVTWLQFSLLPASLPGAVKAALVFAGAVALSWSLSATLRRIPAVRRVI